MMKTSFLTLLVIVIISSCAQKDKPDGAGKYENTLISVSFYSDTTGTDPSSLFRSFEKVNKTIDSIGYPDAGYKLWIVQSDTSRNIRYMIEGSWPDQEIYDTIHENNLYLNAMKELQNTPFNLKQVFYNRFTLVK